MSASDKADSLVIEYGAACEAIGATHHVPDYESRTAARTALLDYVARLEAVATAAREEACPRCARGDRLNADGMHLVDLDMAGYEWLPCEAPKTRDALAALEQS